MNLSILVLFHIPQIIVLLSLAIHRWASSRFKKYWFLMMTALCVMLLAALGVYDVHYLDQQPLWLTNEVNLGFYIAATELKYVLLILAGWKSFQVFKSNN